MSGRGRVGFLKPQEDGESYEEDRPDIQPLRFCSDTVTTQSGKKPYLLPKTLSQPNHSCSQTSFVYDAHPGQALDAHRARLPVAKARDQLLYLLEKHQVPLPLKFNVILSFKSWMKVLPQESKLLFPLRLLLL